jgi:hypothetical protein
MTALTKCFLLARNGRFIFWFLLGFAGLSVDQQPKIHLAVHWGRIPYRTLQNYLLDEREPNAKAMGALRTHLGISVDWLLTGEGSMFHSVSGEGVGPESANMQEKAMLELFCSLGDAGKREIQSAAEEKKRLMDVEQHLKDLTEALADTKRPA